jgi:hypothetical protein
MEVTGWSLVELSARLLAPCERESVLGDLAEANQNALRSLLDVFGLFFRRQMQVWSDWRPWLAGFGIALPSSYLLMCVSASVTSTYMRLFEGRTFWHGWPTGHEGLPLLMCHIFLLIAWSWTSGFVVGSLSRRTVWASLLLCLVPCFLCSAMFLPLPKFCLFMFVVPGIWGLRQGLRHLVVDRAWALALAAMITLLMLIAWKYDALWIFNWGLVLPVWYFATSFTTRRDPMAQNGLAV